MKFKERLKQSVKGLGEGSDKMMTYDWVLVVIFVIILLIDIFTEIKIKYYFFWGIFLFWIISSQIIKNAKLKGKVFVEPEKLDIFKEDKK